MSPPTNPPDVLAAVAERIVRDGIVNVNEYGDDYSVDGESVLAVLRAALGECVREERVCACGHVETVHQDSLKECWPDPDDAACPCNGFSANGVQRTFEVRETEGT